MNLWAEQEERENRDSGERPPDMMPMIISA